MDNAHFHQNQSSLVVGRNILAVIRSTCKDDRLAERVEERVATGTSRQPLFEDRLLVIAFNFPHYAAIPYLESLYRASFPNILYCTNVAIHNTTLHFKLFTMRLRVGGDVGKTEDGILKDLRLDVTFKAYPYSTLTYYVKYVLYDFGRVKRFHGETPYYCIEEGIRHFPGLRGYFYLGDDAMFNFWRVMKKDPDKFWVNRGPINCYDIKTEKGSHCIFDMKQDSLRTYRQKDWYWWSRYNDQMHLSLTVLKLHSALSRKCLNQLKTEGGKSIRLFSSQTDFYYVPQVRVKEFLHISRLFRTVRLWHEIAVPTLVNCLTKPSEQETVLTYYNWNYHGNRRKPWIWYPKQMNNSRTMLMHPIKLGPIADASENDTELFCRSIFPSMLQQTW